MEDRPTEPAGTVVWVTVLSHGSDAHQYHDRATCCAKDGRRVPTVRKAAQQAGLGACRYCTKEGQQLARMRKTA